MIRTICGLLKRCLNEPGGSILLLYAELTAIVELQPGEIYKNHYLIVILKIFQ